MPARKRRSFLYTQVLLTMSVTDKNRHFVKQTSCTPSALMSLRLAFDAKPPSRLTCLGGATIRLFLAHDHVGRQRTVRRIAFQHDTIEHQPRATRRECHLVAEECFAVVLADDVGVRLEDADDLVARWNLFLQIGIGRPTSTFRISPSCSATPSS
jgi:hypothetical protein